MLEFFDSHTHLTDEQFKGVKQEIIDNARASGVTYMVDVGYNEETSIDAINNANMYDNVYATVGLHPENCNEFKNFDFIYNLCQHDKVVAIGEVGLDYHWSYDKDTQKEIFVSQIKIANELKKPVVIHSRDADMDMLEILKKNKVEYGFVMHCFSSSIEVMKEALKLGAYISLAGPVTFKNARSLIEVAKLVPSDRLLIETDAPYLAPEPHRGKRNEPAYVVNTAKKIAELRECSIENLAKITTDNAKSFYNI